jgi:hypothetical protein
MDPARLDALARGEAFLCRAREPPKTLIAQWATTCEPVSCNFELVSSDPARRLEIRGQRLGAEIEMLSRRIAGNGCERPGDSAPSSGTIAPFPTSATFRGETGLAGWLGWIRTAERRMVAERHSTNPSPTVSNLVSVAARVVRAETLLLRGETGR